MDFIMHISRCDLYRVNIVYVLYVFYMYFVIMLRLICIFCAQYHNKAFFPMRFDVLRRTAGITTGCDYFVFPYRGTRDLSVTAV